MFQIKRKPNKDLPEVLDCHVDHAFLEVPREIKKIQKVTFYEKISWMSAAYRTFLIFLGKRVFAYALVLHSIAQSISGEICIVITKDARINSFGMALWFKKLKDYSFLSFRYIVYKIVNRLLTLWFSIF